MAFSISGAECVAALRLAGFSIMQHCGGLTFLGDRDRIVVVPDAMVLPEDVVESLLAEADLSYDRFLWLISEATTLPDLPLLAPLDS